MTDGEVVALGEFLRGSRRLLILTGAGCSTASGIPDYRDEAGRWKHRKPMSYSSFVSSERHRKRYWAGSALGFGRIHRAQPNSAHAALCRLEAAGRVQCLVTQNVDGLHQRAGSRQVVDLHGRLDRVQCVECTLNWSRQLFQRVLLAHNPRYSAALEVHVPGAAPQRPATAPDGDVLVSPESYDDFVVPSCPRCGGVVKPDVVFFGESVPRSTVERVSRQLARADGVLVVGTSLMVYSGFRFVKAAAAAGLPIGLVNLGCGRADGLATLCVRAACEDVLAPAVDLVARRVAS